jgi:hypothetical protein
MVGSIAAYMLVGNSRPMSSTGEPYLLVGGQSGRWFENGQIPKLFRISLSDNSVQNLDPVSGQGAVWSGDWNGSQWLVSGWGNNLGPNASNPYLYLYDGRNQSCGRIP